ncbi:MAG: DNA polymerase III subunit alpha [Magnetovibrionaceae bacterium]
MTHAGFVHLRVHTAYSLSEGAVRVKELPGLCAKLGMPAVAMCDTSNLFGALEFGPACAKSGVQPIIGCLIGVRRTDGDPRAAVSPKPDRLPLLVQNETGYANLLRLLKIAYLDGEDSEEPCVGLSDLAEKADGLIVLSGGLDGPIGRLLAAGQKDAAGDLLSTLQATFPDRLYIELQRHGLADQIRIEPDLLDFAYDRDIPLVATNDVFYPEADMFEAHDALMCIAQGAYLSQDDRDRKTPEHWFKPADEMARLFEDLPEAIDNTVVIAQRCAYQVETRGPLLPPFDCGEGRTEVDELRAQSHEGLTHRLETAVFEDGWDSVKRQETDKRYRERLDYELDVIIQMGFPGYFLIVADFIQWAKDHDIPVGPGRGSGAGSVVAWSLLITDLDPIRFGLLFERFLNPERVSMPDFDVDFCQDRRDEVIRFVQDKYGYEHVAQIITFGKLQARAVLRDVGRVMQLPFGQVDRICKLVPNNPANPVTLAQAIEQEPMLKEQIDTDEQVAQLANKALKLEGLYRHASTHAAGVVIGDRPLDQLIPLYRDPRSTMPVTGFNMKYVESTGLIKFDFLGLKTLTVLTTAVNLIKEGGKVIDLSTIPLDDKPSFEMMSRGETTGVFQLESAGMRDVLRKMKPDTFEDIIAVVALYRPGPMDNIPSYIRRKHGEEEPDYLYPTLEPILKETFGIMIYQEQVMQIAQVLGGYSLGGADLLRRAMGKKIKEEMEKQRVIFIEGAENKGCDKKLAGEIFDQVNKFAGYGFNKSHAAAYALVAYQTAYLKANYPVEFLAASMTLDITNTDKLNLFRQELDRLKIPVRPPDVNASQVVFSVERDPEGKAEAVRYALAAVKNVGAAAMQSIVDERSKDKGSFTSITGFADRMDAKAVNKKQIENLIRAGAFDSLDPNRRKLFTGAERILNHAGAATNDRNSDQIGLFGGGGGEAAQAPDIRLDDTPDWSPMDRLKEEFDAVGFYLSAHPLDAYAKTLKRLQVRNWSDLMEAGHDEGVTLAGTVISKKERVSARGNRFAFIQFSDATGAYEGTVFSETLAASRDLLETGQSVIIKGALQFEGETARLTINSLQALDQVAANTDAGLKITLADPRGLGDLKTILSEGGKGRGSVFIEVSLEDGAEAKFDLGQRFRISPTVLHGVRAIAGVAAVEEL